MKNLALVSASLLFAVGAVRTQEWRPEQVADAGIEIEAPGRLERLPMQLGQEALYHRARFRPKDNQDFVQSQYEWYCDVYEFTTKDTADEALPKGLTPEAAEELKKILATLGGKRCKTFKEWFDEENKDASKVTIEVAGKATKGKPGKLDYKHWVWRKTSGYGPCGDEFCEAAVYSLGEREVALVVEMPLETKKPGVPKSKWKNLIDHMIASGKLLSAAPAAESEGDKKRDQFADTPAKKEALAAAKKNIQGLPGWDYFTQPHYVVIYSWDFEKPDERPKAKQQAEYYSQRLEKMRELYQTHYAMDAEGVQAVMPDPKTIPDIKGPVTGATPTPPKPADADSGDADDPADASSSKEPAKPYSVFRLCATYDQFQKYGQSPPGVVGWFSPHSKELVVFLGGDKMMGQGATETVTYHEGWHQYADHYFHPPGAAKYAELHRWFDEGHGDYFGSYRWMMNGWKYVGSKMRYEDVKNMVRAGDYVPFKDIVRWDCRHFYAQKAPYYYAQAYSMIDFLRRGEKSPGWKPRWGEILDLYRKVVLVKCDAKLAVDTGFRDFKDEDWKELEDAWKAWVNGPNFMNGK